MSLWYRLFPLVERQGLFLCQSAKVGLAQFGSVELSAERDCMARGPLARRDRCNTWQIGMRPFSATAPRMEP